MSKVLLTHPARDLPFFFGDAAVTRLREFADVIVNDSEDRLTDKDILCLAPDCEVIISEWWTGAGAAVFSENRNLVAFVRCGVEILNVDSAAATQEGVLIVRTTPTPIATPVAEYTIGLMIMLSRGIPALMQRVSSGTLRRAYDFSVTEGRHPRVYPGFSLADEILGIVGLGEIGRQVAVLAKALGMRVLATDPYVKSPVDGVEMVDLDNLLRQSRVNSLHVKLNDDTRHMIGRNQLQRMRPDALLINTARGALVDNAALAQALNERRIAGAGLDVFEDEPDFAGNPLMDCDNVVLTPHTAGLTEWGIRHQAAQCVEIVGEILAGKVPNSVANPEAIPHARLNQFIPTGA